MSGWGWDPSSFEAIGTSAAALIAATALRQAIRQQKSSLDERLRAQARLVSVQRVTRRENRGRLLTVLVTNASSSPINAVLPAATFGADPATHLDHLLGHPIVGSLSVRGLTRRPWDRRRLVVADVGWTFLDAGQSRRHAVWLDPEHPPLLDFGLVFTDASGRRWHRSALSGALTVFA
ncbi:hypothetical protein FB561_2705 [Kribbella amoyensis]|uniref:Uncharacterized protein n=1 Tax=Kribbella amoyensis TaxID=996641 RepID=A0A561BS08_9ACTN|nr:hypothetical protein [Kribbella amoyensis]TWD81589.1 hypothetical protein FB561_2705 [Kribbella amoyensis]